MGKIDIRIAGESLDLPDNISIPFEISNNIADIDQLQDVVTYPFSIPATPNNLRILGHPDNLQNVSGLQEKRDASIYDDCDELYRGYILFKSGVYAKSISLSFISGAGSIKKDIKNNTLRDYDYGGLISIDDFDTHGGAGYPTVPGIMPVIVNDNIFENKPIVDNDKHYFINKGGAKSPTIFLNFVIDYILNYNGYKQSGCLVDDLELNSICLPNPFVYGTLNTVTENNYSIYNLSSFTGNIDPRNHLPNIKVVELLKALRSSFALGFYFNDKLKELKVVPIKDIINGTDVIDITQYFTGEFEYEPNNYNGVTFDYRVDTNDALFNKDFSLIDKTELYPIETNPATYLAGKYYRMPEGEEFYKLMDDDNGYFFCFSQENCGKTIKDFTLRDTYNDFNEFISDTKGEGVFYIKNLNQYWSYFEDTDTNHYERFYCDEFDSLRIDNGAEKIDLGFCFMPMRMLKSRAHLMRGLFPFYRVKRSSFTSSRNENDFALRFAFAESGYLSKLLNPYTLTDASDSSISNAARTHNYDLAGNKIGNYSLYLSGADGLYNVWWKPVINFYKNTKPVTMHFMFDKTFIMNLDLTKKYRVNGVNYIIDKVFVDFPIKNTTKLRLLSV